VRPEIIPQVRALVQPLDFYSDRHQAIVTVLYDLGDSSTIITVADALTKSNKLETAGGMDYLIELVDPGMSAGWRYHADLILEASRRRQVINACAAASEMAFKQDLTETLSNLSDSLKIIERRQAPVAIDNIWVLGNVVEKAQARRTLEGVSTGFKVIDEPLGILEPGTTCYLAARPSIGKTALAVAIIDNVMREGPGAVLLFSLEMTGEAIMRRRLSSKSGVYLSRLRHGDVAESQWPDIIEAADYLSVPHPIIIDNPKFKRIERLIAYSQAVAQDKKISLIVVDHIQKMSSVRKAQSRHHELSYVSERLCDLAKDIRCPVLVLCQLRRPGNESKDKRPQLEMMKESGDLEANADIVLGLYRVDKQSVTMEVHCLKNRDGAAGWTGYLEFEPQLQTFKDGREPEETTSRVPYKEDV
jgi:replicative DNA helicase